MSRKRYQLLNDVKSNVKHSYVYGHAGDIVELISDHGNVFIVELNGERFPAHINSLTEDFSIIHQSINQTKNETTDHRGKGRKKNIPKRPGIDKNNSGNDIRQAGLF